MLFGGFHGTAEGQVRLPANARLGLLLRQGLDALGRRFPMFFEALLALELLGHQIPVGTGFVVVESTQDSDAPNEAVHVPAVGDEVLLVLDLAQNFGGGSEDFRTLPTEVAVVFFAVDGRLAEMKQLEGRSKRLDEFDFS